ncbi:proteinase-activated receptor 3 [Lissotriton helveticus]
MHQTAANNISMRAALALGLLALCFLPPGACEDEKATPNPKTFRGHPKDYEKLSHHILNSGSEEPSNEMHVCSKWKSNEAILQVSNTTMKYLTSSVSTGLIPAVYIAVIMVGIPANAITLWMLFFRTRAGGTSVFYINLAISDCLFCIMLFFKISYHLKGNHWVFGETMCRAMTVAFYGNMYCSILLLMCISISRYLAIVHPFLYRSLAKRRYAILQCVLVWAVVFVYMLPFTITKQSYQLDELNVSTCHDVQNACNTSSTFHFYYYIFLAVFGFLVPLAIIIFCCISIIRTLSTHDQKWYWYVKMTVLILTIFAVCFTPSNIILIIHQVKYYYTSTDDLYFYYLIALCLSSLNSCLDPFLYFFMSKMTGQTRNYVAMFKMSEKAQLQCSSE